MDEASKLQSLLIAITIELDKNALDMSNLRKLTDVLLEEAKTQRTALASVGATLLKLEARLKVLEAPKAAVPPVMPSKKSWLAQLLNK